MDTLEYMEKKFDELIDEIKKADLKNRNIIISVIRCFTRRKWLSIEGF